MIGTMVHRYTFTCTPHKHLIGSRTNLYQLKMDGVAPKWRLLPQKWMLLPQNGCCCLCIVGQVTHMWVSKLTIISSDNSLKPDQHQSIIWTNTGILLIGLLGTNFSGNSIEIHIFSFKKMHLKMLSVKWQPVCLCLNVLIIFSNKISYTDMLINILLHVCRWTKSSSAFIPTMLCCLFCPIMTMPSNGNIFRVTGPLCREFTGH